MSENLLTSDGLLIVPGTSEAINDEENMDTSDIPEDDLLDTPDNDNITSFQVPQEENNGNKQREPNHQTEREP